MAEYDYDFFVIGAGSGGVRASRVAASFGARVAVAEDGRLGGTCVNVGCIPKKLLVYASHFHQDFEDAAMGYGWTVGERSFDWPTLIANKDREIERLNGIFARLLDQAGVTNIEGRARLVDPHTVAVGDQRYTAQHILVATGGRPVRPSIPGAEHAITSDEAFALERLPQRVLIVGGGYIAVEFAGIFQGLGAQVIQAYRGALFLRGFDDDARTLIASEIQKAGIELRLHCEVEAIEKTSEGLRAVLSDGEIREVDQVFYAIGRHPNTESLGLEEIGVDVDESGAIVVDDYSRSSIESIFAIGDVTNRVNLTPVAINEGICVANTLFNDRPMIPDHEAVPSAVFSQPALATVGLTETEARERYTEIDVYVSEFRALKHTLTGRDERSLMKLIVERVSQRVLGLHVVSPDAAEIVQGFAVGIKLGATKADFDATVAIHPTAAEELVTMREPRADPA
jgi:glutathione reductase (NADPH)